MLSPSRASAGCVVALTFGVLITACDHKPASAARATVDAASIAPSSIYPVELRDDRGRTVRVRAEPLRIVSLLPSHTETLFALGVGAHVVGVDDYSDDPPEATRLPRLGGIYDAHLEQVLSLKPDLVLLSESSNAAAPLEQSGVTVWGGSARTFDDIFRVIQALGKIVGRSPDAARLSERIQQEVAAIEQRVAGRERVSVYYELDATPYTVGPSSFIGAMLAKAGGNNVIPEGLGAFPKISPEIVIAGNPSVILGASLEEISSRPGWGKIAAVLAGRVHKLPEAEAHLVARPGPRIAEGLRALARWLHPEVEP